MAAAQPRRASACLPDEKLIERIAAGDEAAFEEIYERYFKRVYHFVRQRLHNHQDTEETVQEVFIGIFCSLDSFRGEGPFSAWVLGLTRRTVASRFKKKRHATVPLLPDDEPEKLDLTLPVLRCEPTPLEHYECRERLDRLEEAANELTPAQWQLFELHHLESRSIREVARAVQKSPDAVKSHLYRARKLLLAR